MEIRTAQSNLIQARFAVQQVMMDLEGEQPHLIVVAASPASHFDTCQALLHQEYPQVQIIGGSSFDGLMTQEGVCQSDTGCSLGVWCLSDSSGSYGVGYSHYGDDLGEAVSQALSLALSHAGRNGELPALVWLQSASGKENQVLQQLAQILGEAVPVVGGGASTSQAEQGPALVSCNGQSSSNGVALAVFFPSGHLGYSFHSGCSLVKPLGVATKVEGQTLIEIDHQPALSVFEQALEAKLESKITDEQWADIPIGRLVGERYNLPMFTLSLPTQIKRSSILLSAPVQIGERLFLMKGSREGLKERGKRVLTNAMEMLPQGRLGLQPKGALIAYCAACMQLLSSELDEEVEAVRQVLGEQSAYLTQFTSSEVGPLLHAQNVHGNLMIAAVVFYGKGTEV